jgi:hypothetical protein
LAANKNVEFISPDSKTLVSPPQTDLTAVLHLSPDAYTFQEVDSSEEIYEMFEALRILWDFQAFEGTLKNPKGVFTRTFKKLADV